MVRINIKNQNSKKSLSLDKLKLAVKKVLKLLKKRNVELNILFVTSRKMRVFNLAYFGKDVSTDVIAFPAPSYRCTGLGDIVVSLDKAAKNAKIYQVSFFDETLLYVIHGILHFEGYNDKCSRDRFIMRRKEIELLQKIGKISE